MNDSVSKYLELLRVVSALGVFLYHASYDRFTGVTLDFDLGFGIGHIFVIVFFVLSGYVIAYASDVKDKSFFEFFSSRLSRFVVVPVLIFVPLLDYWGSYLDPSLYDGTVSNSYIFLRFIINVFFLQEIWFESFRYSSNGPLWSIGYEFWYYFIFSSLIYFNGVRRVIVFLAFSILVGPKIMLLFPVWFLGVAVYFFHKKYDYIRYSGFVLMISALGMSVLVFSYELLGFGSFSNALLNRGFGFSSDFLFDYFFSVFVSASILSMKYLTFPAFFLRPFSIFSSSSFFIYVAHYPILLFVFSVFDLVKQNWLSWFFGVSLALFVCVFIGNYIESKRFWMKRIMFRTRNLKFKIKGWK